jgi:hypothetical protein
MFPYGMEVGTATAKDRVQFATYFDSDEGTYADQRWYDRSTGRFYTPDPYWRAGEWRIRVVGIGTRIWRGIR